MIRFLSFSLLFISFAVHAQNNIFQSGANVGIGAANPSQKLDVVGNIYLRNMANAPGAGASISFSSYDIVHLGPKIYSYLDYASGAESASRLILSSYWNGYQNELTLNAGRVGIGTLNPDEKLTVNGRIHAKEVRVDNTVPVPDYVFTNEYSLLKLKEIEKFVKLHSHLPDVPSAAEMEKNGVNVSEMQMLLLRKIEELTLHLIEKDKQITDQKINTQIQDSHIKSLEAKVALILSKIK